MKNIAHLFLLVFFISCAKSTLRQDGNRIKLNTYMVYKIDKENDYYLIYAKKKDSLYKIVSKNESPISDCNKIKINNYYDFKLHSRRENSPTIGGIKLNPVNYLDIQCYTYDKDTKICIDIKNGIFDLYYADNIKGLCFIKN
ncbi:hypothetical protein [Flavobacterium sp. B183]|uniref:hypothetical protein n=1 Tax=Flavobacterium sp. B183 TaxID=907046 RepID=UPI00201F42E5|nr:hypothetical protein [Flavobacterium sp. B183]URC11861.1 hypothetical protein M4I44_17405 [Flavobacterium sp. B183]